MTVGETQEDSSFCFIGCERLKAKLWRKSRHYSQKTLNHWLLEQLYCTRHGLKDSSRSDPRGRTPHLEPCGV